MAPALLADDDGAALAAGELIATVALPPHVPLGVDADSAGLVLLADNCQVRDGAAGEQHESVDPSRKLFDVTASGDPSPLTWRAPTSSGALATAAQLVGAGQAMLDMSVEYAKQRSQFGRVIGTYQAIKHKLADAYIAVELRGRWSTGRRCRSPTNHRTPSAMSAPPRWPPPTPRCWRRSALQTHGAWLHRRARPVAVAVAGAGPAIGVGRCDRTPAKGLEAL